VRRPGVTGIRRLGWVGRGRRVGGSERAPSTQTTGPQPPPGARRDPRSACAWTALGHATARFDAALPYACPHQFGRTLSPFPIIQRPSSHGLRESDANHQR
jgi:hypothetical protein